MSRYRLGCTGWGYDDWRGGFYPPGTPPGDYLKRYARAFTLVEVDSSYYAAPTLAQTLRWVDATPASFTFALKFPGSVTHDARLADADEAINAFLRAVEPLRAARKLGPLVAQFPPTFVRRKDAAALEAFVASIPRDVPLAVELRHASWWVADTRRVLEARGAALVWSVNQYADTPPWVTADWGYARFIGDREITRFDRVQRDKRDEMREWKARFENEGASAESIYVLLNNHFMGFAPETAAIMAEILGIPRPDLAAAARTGPQRGLTDFS